MNAVTCESNLELRKNEQVDKPVIEYYRRLLKTGFQNAGSLENPSIFLDTVGENLPICDQVGRDYLHLYLDIEDGTIGEVKYLCSCDPTANVVVEILCTLVKGKTLDEVETLKVEMFSQALGCNSDEFIKKAEGIIELMNRGLRRYQEHPR
jgi:NifU-like protein involved in Fe-S cluster formation